MLATFTNLVEEAMRQRPAVELPRGFRLPCMPQSVVEFTSIANNPEAGPKQLAKPIEADAALASGLLRQVNSASVGLRQSVTSTSHAINLLGTRRTKTLVLTSALQAATAATTSRLVNMAQFQKENRIRAAFARRAAQALGADAEIAYLGGLLQDFLVPMLTEAFYSKYVDIRQQEHELVEEEQRQLGWNHAQVAAGVMYDWGFPPELVACVLFHHDAERVLSDESLRASCVGASVAAGALPESLGQSPGGFETLMRMQSEMPEFVFLEIAHDVDEELNGGELQPGQGDGLCDRLGELAVANLEQRRVDRVHQNRQLGNYILENQIGEGAMGQIFRGRHSMLKRPAAIKVLRAGSLNATTLALFESEVQQTCQLTSPNTVSVYDYGVTPEGLFYYVMEYLEGVTVAQLVRRSGPLSAGRAIHFLMQACTSLVEAHGLRLIHRDLKPENLMVCSRGGVPDTIKVLDFGLATAVSKCAAQDQAPAGITGTPHYMSPESITAPQTADVRSDLYSLGATAYFMITGQVVFPNQKLNAVIQSQLLEKPQRPSERLGAPVDADLEEIVLRCLAKSRDDRPASSEELRKMLSQCRSAGTWNPADAPQMIREITESPPVVSATTTDDDLSDTVVGQAV